MNSDPVDIRELNPTELQITWADQHISRFTFAWLRERCPCAMCRHRKEQGGIDDLLGSMVRPDMHARDISTVGRYALNIVFGDGHDSGIFTFDMLRADCPCPTCTSPAQL